VADPRDIEALRGAYGQWARGDFTSADMFTTDAEFVVAGPDPRTYVGHEGVRDGWFDFLSAWDDFRSEALEIIEGEGEGEGVYLVLLHLTARGKESSVPIDAEGAATLVMRDGKIARFEMFWDRDAAMRAVGLK
jgi:ketosteroid isomerase-like protein